MGHNPAKGQLISASGGLIGYMGRQEGWLKGGFGQEFPLG